MPLLKDSNFEAHFKTFFLFRSSHRRYSLKKVLLEISQNSQENTCARVFIKKETLAQVLSCEFCEICKNTSSYRTSPVAVSAYFVEKSRYILQIFNFPYSNIFNNCDVAGFRKIPPGKIPTQKIPTHQTLPWKIPPGKFPPGIFPPISLIVFLHYLFT